MLRKSPKSLTGSYLRDDEKIEMPEERRAFERVIKIKGAKENNLKNIDVSIPLGVMTVVSGVSGAGKSTLINDILYPVLANKLHDGSHSVGKHSKIEGIEQINKIINIDQQPIGRTPRSNPATYTKVFDHIRDLFAQLPEDEMRGYEKGRFSFKVKYSEGLVTVR